MKKYICDMCRCEIKYIALQHNRYEMDTKRANGMDCKHFDLCIDCKELVIAFIQSDQGLVKDVCCEDKAPVLEPVVRAVQDVLRILGYSTVCKAPTRNCMDWFVKLQHVYIDYMEKQDENECC